MASGLQPIAEANNSSVPVNVPSPLIAETVGAFPGRLRNNPLPKQPPERRELPHINQHLPRSQLRGGACDSTVSSRHR